LDRRSFLQLVEARERYYFSRTQTFHCSRIAVRALLGDISDRHHIPVDNEDKGSRSIALDRGAWNENGIFERFHQQSRIDKLVWKQREVVIAEFTPESNGTSRSVNLVVHTQQASGCHLRFSGPVKRFHNKRFVLTQLCLNLSEMIFRHVEHDRNRLKFGDHHEGVRTPRKNVIAGIDEPQTNSAGSGGRDVTVAKPNLCILHLTKIEFDGPLILNHNLLLVVENLLCNGIRSEGLPVASKINLRLLENPTVVIE